MTQPRPYGTWPSPITPELMAGASAVSRGFPISDGTNAYWLETRPGSSRTVLVQHAPDGSTRDLGPDGFDVGTRVHEYGGGEVAARDGVILASEATTGRVWRLDGDPRPITPALDGMTLRFAAFAIDPDRGVAYCVREDHRRGDIEPLNELVRITLDGPNDDVGQVIRAGQERPTGDTQDQTPGELPDFVTDPMLSPDGARLAWTEWTHPAMSWDSSYVCVADLDAAGGAGTPRRLAGGPTVSAHSPIWLSETEVAFLDERTGWWLPYAVDVTSGVERPLVPTDTASEFGGPVWVNGQRFWARLADGRVAVQRSDGGFSHLTLLDAADPADPAAPAELPADGPTSVSSLSALGSGVLCYATYADRPAAILLVDPASGAAHALATSGASLDPAYLPEPQPITWPGGGGTAHGFLYLPRNPDALAPAGTLPPLIVTAHGGPTAGAEPTPGPSKVFWTSRGYAVLDVNYAGSIGFGREYRDRLRGQWGVADIEDVVRGAQHLADTGVVDPTRMAVRGGSAGGFVVVAALAFHDVFTAGLARYPVTDLALIAQDTHKLESRYMEGLIGPWPAARDVFEARSPLAHADRIATPLLLLQGADDPVCPPSQSRALAEAVRATGTHVEYVELPGERHGFRQPENVARAWQCELDFLAQTWGI